MRGTPCTTAGRTALASMVRTRVELANAMVDLHEPRTAPPRSVDELRRCVPSAQPADPAWHHAYELAEDLHEELRAESGESGDDVDIEEILEGLGVTVMDRDLSDQSIRGVAIAGAQHRPGVLVNSGHRANQHPFGRRFTLAHELCHLLFDGDVSAPLALASGPWAPRDVERRANAFAAMFLMPTRLVRRAVATLPRPVTSRDDVLTVANRLRTGFPATLWHLSNFGYVDSVTRERIEQDGGRTQP